MKNTSSLIVVLFFLHSSYGQQWISPGAEWKFLDASIGGYTIVSAKLDTDTIINSSLCQIISLNSYGSLKKYYTLQSNDTIFFFVLNQFRPSIYLGASVGDTLNLYNPSFKYFSNCNVTDSFLRYRVDSIYYTSIDTLSLKKFDLTVTSNPNGFVWQSKISYIERIGFASNVYPQFSCASDANEYYLCSYKDSAINWQQSNCSVGIHDVNTIKASIYPNPVSNQLLVSINDYKDVSIQFYDMLGEKIYDSKPENEETIIDVSHWQRGIYLYRMERRGAVAKSDKIVLE
jgi:hypothetical protein